MVCFKVPLDVQIEMSGLLVPEREFKFWKGRKYRIDLAWPAIKLAVEIEGGLYRRGEPCPMCGQKPPGAHSSIQRMLTDMEKYNRLNLDGWMLIRVQPEEVENGSALDKVEQAMLTIKLREDTRRIEYDESEVCRPEPMSKDDRTKSVRRWKELKLKLRKP